MDACGSMLVRKGGLEPPWVSPPDPKSGASANSATLASATAAPCGIHKSRCESASGAIASLVAETRVRHQDARRRLIASAFLRVPSRPSWWMVANPAESRNLKLAARLHSAITAARGVKAILPHSCSNGFASAAGAASFATLKAAIPIAKLLPAFPPVSVGW